MRMALHNNDAVQKYNVNERFFRLASHINTVHKNGGVYAYISFSQRRWLGQGGKRSCYSYILFCITN